MPIKEHLNVKCTGQRTSNKEIHFLQLNDTYELKTADDDVLTQLQTNNGNIIDVENILTAQTAELQAIKTNTANIKASIEVGGDLYISQDQVEAYLVDIDNSVKANAITVAKLNQILVKNTEIDTVLDSISAKNTDIDNSVKANAVTVAKLNQILVKNTSIESKLTDISAKTTDVDNSVTASSAIVSKLTQIKNLTDTFDAVLDASLVKQTEAEAHLGNIDTGIDVLEACVGSNKLNVNLSSGGFSGAVTNAGLTKLEGAINLDKLDVVVTNNISGGSTEAKQDIMETSLNAIVSKNTQIETLITATNSKIDTFDSVLDASLVKQTNIETLITTLDGVQDNVLTKLGEIETTNNANQVLLGTIDEDTNSIKGHVDGIETLITATNSKIDTFDSVLDASLVKQTNIESLITTLDGVQDNVLTKLGEIETTNNANQVLLGTIDEDTNAIKGHVDGIETLITATNSKIDTFDSVLDASLVKQTNIESLITTLDGVQDNVLTKLGEIETTNNANQVLLGTIDADTNDIKTSVQILDDIVLAEDAAHSSGQKGIMTLAVRNDVLESLGADNDYQPLQVDAYGAVYTVNSANWSGITSLFSGSISGSGATGQAINIPTTPNSIMVIECIATITSDGNPGSNAYTVGVEGAIASGGLYQVIQGNINDVQGNPVVSFIGDIPTVRPFIKLLITNNHNVAQTFNIRSVRHGN